MKRFLLLASSLFFASPVMSAEITSRITDSVQLTVEGPAVQSVRTGSSYSVSGSNISVTTLGGLTAGSATAAASTNAGSYSISDDGAPFSFSETMYTGDTPVTAQTTLSTNGRVAAPNLYSDSTTQLGGTAGDLAGTLTAGGGVPTVTAGGPGSTAVGQRTMELSVFN